MGYSDMIVQVCCQLCCLPFQKWFIISEWLEWQRYWNIRRDGFPGLLPWKSRVLAIAQFEFAQRVTLETSKILTPRFPWPRTLTNHICVSDIGGAKSLLFNRPDWARVYWLALLVWIRHPLYSSDGRSVIQLLWYFQMHAGCRPSSWARFHYSLPDLTAF